jgi:phosphopentomutase/2,3-bisphosphoglycerate-independent phosphoglycerate mutase family metalloenzyme
VKSRVRAIAPVFAAIALIAVGGLYAFHAAVAGTEFFPSLNSSRPHLSTAPPVLPPAPPRLSHRVVLVIVDGLAERASHDLPFLDRLRNAGASAVAVAHFPSISQGNYVAITTGVPPEHSGVRNNHYQTRVDLDSLMHRARAAGMATAFVSDYDTSFPRMFGDDLDEAYHAPWARGLVIALRRTLSGEASLIVVNAGAVDSAGHEHGADSEEYSLAALEVDHSLSVALGDLDLTRDTLVILADHGHTDGGGHGGAETAVLEVPLVMAGAGIRAGTRFGGDHRDDDALPGLLFRPDDVAPTAPRLIDVAPTVAALLGMPAPGHGLGRTLTEALDVDDTAAAALRSADRTRIGRNHATVTVAAGAAAERAHVFRGSSIPLAAAAFGLAMIVTLASLRAGALHIDWKVLACAAPAFPATFYVLVGLAGRVSLSNLPAEALDVQTIFFYGGASIAVHVLASLASLRGRVDVGHRLAAANAITLCGMLCAGLPALLTWAYYGGDPFVTLPGPKMLFLIPAMYIAMACYAVAAALTLSIEVVVYLARLLDPRRLQTPAPQAATATARAGKPLGDGRS